MSVMNLAVRLLQLFCVTLLYFSAVKVSFCVCALRVCTLVMRWDHTRRAFDKDALVTEVIDRVLVSTSQNV